MIHSPALSHLSASSNYNSQPANQARAPMKLRDDRYVCYGQFDLNIRYGMKYRLAAGLLLESQPMLDWYIKTLLLVNSQEGLSKQLRGCLNPVKSVGEQIAQRLYAADAKQVSEGYAAKQVRPRPGEPKQGPSPNRQKTDKRPGLTCQPQVGKKPHIE